MHFISLILYPIFIELKYILIIKGYSEWLHFDLRNSSIFSKTCNITLWNIIKCASGHIHCSDNYINFNKASNVLLILLYQRKHIKTSKIIAKSNTNTVKNNTVHITVVRSKFDQINSGYTHNIIKDI